jgi:hypothetical protein
MSVLPKPLVLNSVIAFVITALAFESTAECGPSHCIV